MNIAESDQSLVVRNDVSRTVEATERFRALVTAALEESYLVNRCDNETDNQRLTVALVLVEKVRKELEECRVQCKAPVLEFCRAIDAFFAAETKGLLDEKTRLGTMAGNYHTILQQQARAAEALRKKELDDIERRKQEQLQAAKSHDEIDAIQARANQEVQAAMPLPQQIRARGQTVTPDVDFDVFDIDALYRSHPHLVKMEPKRTEIKASLKAGIALPGVRKLDVVRVGTRVGKGAMVEV